MDALEFRIRCLEMAERLHMRSADNNFQNILETFRKIENDLGTRLSPACPEAPEEDQKELSRTAPFQPSGSRLDYVEKSSSVLKGKPGKTILD